MYQYLLFATAVHILPFFIEKLHSMFFNCRADAVFQSMKSVYGSHTCFLLQINSKAKMFPNAPEADNVSDPWSIYLYPFADETLV